MNKKLTHLILEIASRIVVVFSLVWVYAGIIMGIIMPMLLMVPLYYISWKIFSYFTYNSFVEMWVVLKYSTSDPGVITLIVFEIIIFVIGLILLIWGLITIARTIYKKEGLTIKGPYRFIRHPQHVGIILISLIVSLFLPWTTDMGIRTGEILSWSLFSFILILWSHLEDWFLKRKFKDEFITYRLNTRTFIPRIIGNNRLWSFYSQRKYWIKLLILLIEYIIFVVLLCLLFLLLADLKIFSQVY